MGRCVRRAVHDEVEAAERLVFGSGAAGGRHASVSATALAGQGLGVPEGRTQILPVIVGDAGEAVRASERALEKGIFAQAIRPPTVPAGSSRLRLTVMASHTRSELRDAARVIAGCLPAAVREGEVVPASDAARAASGARVFDGLRDAA